MRRYDSHQQFNLAYHMFSTPGVLQEPEKSHAHSGASSATWMEVPEDVITHLLPLRTEYDAQLHRVVTVDASETFAR